MRRIGTALIYIPFFVVGKRIAIQGAITISVGGADEIEKKLSTVGQAQSHIGRHNQSGQWNAYIWINDAESLFSELQQTGAIIE